MRTHLIGAAWVLAALAHAGQATSPAPAPAPQSAPSPCPVSNAEPCTLVLEGPGAPSASASCSSEQWSRLLSFTHPDRWMDTNGDGRWESVVEIRLDPAKDCGCARFKVFYEERVWAFGVHIGNSPTNNGHGGDQGTTLNTAELQIVDRLLSVYTAAQSVRRQVDKLLEVTVPPLAGRTVAIEVCDQSVEAEVLPTARDTHPSKWKLETLSSKLLFSLGPGEEGLSHETEGSIYAGFNRVIHLTTGAASHKRIGTGVRRVEISLIP